MPAPVSAERLAHSAKDLEKYAALSQDVTEGDDIRIHPLLSKFSFLYIMGSGSKILTVVIVAAGGLLLLAGGAWAADSSKPGDMLYGVDLAVESVQRVVTFGDVAKADFEIDVLDERMEELTELDEEGEEVGEALDEVADQQTRLYGQIRKMEENNDIDEGEKNRVWTRYESRYEYHYEYMNQLKEKQDDGTGSDTGTGIGIGSDNGTGTASDTGSARDTGSNGGSDNGSEGDVVLDSVLHQFQQGGPDFEGPGDYILKQDRDQTSMPSDPGQDPSGPQNGTK